MTKEIKIRNITLGKGIPRICVPLTSSSLPELCREAAAAKAAAPDLAEWRADFYEGLLDEEALTKTLEELSHILDPVPLLFTIRTKAEGGNAAVSQEEYAACNLLAARSGRADLIDVEFFQLSPENAALISALRAEGARVIASSHDFQKTESEEVLVERFREMDRSEADILKMAVMPEDFRDVAAIMLATSEMKEHYTEKPLISMSMGALGAVTRIAGEAFGSAVTFATVGVASAPGQLPVGELKGMLAALHKNG